MIRLKELKQEFPELITTSGNNYFIDGLGWYKQKDGFFGLETSTRDDQGHWHSCNFTELVNMVYTLHGNRDKYMSFMLNKACKVVKKWNKEDYDDIWSMSSEWNSLNPDNEIIVYEIGDDENKVIGFGIEDDTFYFGDDYF